MAASAALCFNGGVSLQHAHSAQAKTLHRRLCSLPRHRQRSCHVSRASHVARSAPRFRVSASSSSGNLTREVRLPGNNSVHRDDESGDSNAIASSSSSVLRAGAKGETSSFLTRLTVGLGLSAAFVLAPFLLPRAHLSRSLLSIHAALASAAVADTPAAAESKAAPSGEAASGSATSSDATVPGSQGTAETEQVMSNPSVTATSQVKGSTSAPADVAAADSPALSEPLEAAKPVEGPKVTTPVTVPGKPAATSAAARSAAAKAAPAKVAVATSAVDVTGKTGDGDVISGIRIAVIKGLNAVSKVLEPSATSAGAAATSAGGKPLNTDYANPKFIYPFLSLIAGLVLIAAGVFAQIRLLFRDDNKPKAPDSPLPFPTARLSNAPRPKSGTSGLVRGAGFGERAVPPSAKFSFKAVPIGSKPPVTSPPAEVPSTAGSVESTEPSEAKVEA